MRRNILAFLAALTMMASPLPAFAAKSEAGVSKKSAVKTASKKNTVKKPAAKTAAKSSQAAGGKKQAVRCGCLVCWCRWTLITAVTTAN